MKTFYRFKRTKKVSERNYSSLWKPVSKNIEKYLIGVMGSFTTSPISTDDKLIEFFRVEPFKIYYYFKSSKDMLLFKLKYGL